MNELADNPFDFGIVEVRASMEGDFGRDAVQAYFLRGDPIIRGRHGVRRSSCLGWQVSPYGYWVLNEKDFIAPTFGDPGYGEIFEEYP